jgi:hypothetical protein
MWELVKDFFISLGKLILALAIFIGAGIAIGGILWLPLHFIFNHSLSFGDFVGIGIAIESIFIAINGFRNTDSKKATEKK